MKIEKLPISDFQSEIFETVCDNPVTIIVAETGFDMEELEFFHRPSRMKIHEAKKSLFALGCVDENGRVTEIGHQVAKLPVSVKSGRMLIEADRRGVVNDILTIVAIIEQGGIVRRSTAFDPSLEWRKFCRGEQKSDFFLK